MTFAESFALEVVYIHNTTNNENDDALNPKFPHPPIRDNPVWSLRSIYGNFDKLIFEGLTALA